MLYPHSTEFRQTGQRADEMCWALWVSLSEKQRKQFGLYQGAQAEQQAAAKRETFGQGSRTGAELVLEILRDSQEKPCNKRQKEIQ